jgi:hypothetical protein
MIIDGREVGPFGGGSGGTLRLLPGEHVVSIRLSDSTAFKTHRYADEPLSVRFIADRGRAYVAAPAYEKDKWRPLVLDKATYEVVSSEVRVDSEDRLDRT